MTAAATLRPAGPGALPRHRGAVLLSRVGIVFATPFAALYALAGSPISAVAIAVMALAVVAVGPAVGRGWALEVVANVVTGVVWLATFVVASPAVVWAFFHPITMYVACGRRSALWWAALSTLQLATLFAADRLGVPFASDLAPATASWLKLSALVGCIAANVGVIAAVERVRVASQEALDRANRATERQRILDDMHDGVGSQLLGLAMQVRADRIDKERLLAGLASCLDDLKLIVDSLDPTDRSFELALAELHARLAPRCEAAGIALLWDAAVADTDLDAARTLQVLRALQELVNNAVRHADTEMIEVTVRVTASVRPHPDATSVEVVVRDHGRGFDPAMPPRMGRGLSSLQTRARRLDGQLRFEPADPGTRVSLRFAA